MRPSRWRKTLRSASNLYRSTRDYRARRTVASCLPAVFWIEPTNACNLRCPFCPTTYNKGRFPTGMMDMGLYRRIVDEISGYCFQSKLLQRGEPLLHPGICDMVAHMTSRGMVAEMDTNAMRLTPALGEGLIDAGLKELSVSLDGYDAETYARSRVGGSFEKVIANVSEFLEIRARRRSPYPFVRIKSIVNERNPAFFADKRTAFIRRFDGLKVDSFDVTQAWNWKKDYLSSDVFELADGRVEDPPPERRRHPCIRMYATMSVMWDGKVVPCCEFFENEYVLGDANERTIAEIWNDEPMRRLRRMSIEDSFPPDAFCRGCWIHYVKEPFGVPLYNYNFASVAKVALGYRNYFRAYRSLRGLMR